MKKYQYAVSGGLGAYSVSRGLPRATDVFVVKANPAQGYYLSISYLSDQELIFLTNGASRGVKQILNCAIHGEGDMEGVYKPKDFATPVGDFGIVPQQLVLMSTDHNIASLQHYGEEQASESETKKLHQKFITISVERIRSMIRRKKVMMR
ncbi:hypothetical protein YC2023_010009 [Brassica napus]